jgi:small subunit ribosomal protein S15
MARMHSRHRGKARSNKPASRSSPSWVQHNSTEVTALVEKLAKEGHNEPTIGAKLRDSHGVPSVKTATGKTISQILKETGNAPAYPTDLMLLIKKAVGLRRHLKTNKKDTLNTTALLKIESKIKRLVKYYRGKKLPKGWKYDPENAALLVK